MALAEYPATLPLPLQEGYGFKHTSPLMRTDMDSGRARQRQRFTSTPSMVTVSWLMTEPEAALFEGWYRYGLTDGADWGLLPIRTPQGIRQYRARFTDIYDGPSLTGGKYWRYSAELEVFERPTLTETETIEIIAGGDFFTAVERLEDVSRLYYTRYWEQGAADGQ